MWKRSGEEQQVKQLMWGMSEAEGVRGSEWAHVPVSVPGCGDTREPFLSTRGGGHACPPSPWWLPII